MIASDFIYTALRKIGELRPGYSAAPEALRGRQAAQKQAKAQRQQQPEMAMNSRHAAHYPAADNPAMSNAVRAPAARFSPRALGLAAAVVTVIIWTSFIVIARATGDPARGGGLSPFDIAMARVLGASLLLLPWGWWLVRRDRRAGSGQSCLFGLSPLPWRITARIGMFGGFMVAASCVLAALTVRRIGKSLSPSSMGA